MQKPFNSIYFQFALLSVSFAILYHHTIINMGNDWLKNDNYSHGFLVPAISAYMIWQQRDKLIGLESHPSYWGLGFRLTGMASFIIGNIGAELFVMRFSIVLTIFGLTIFLFCKQKADSLHSWWMMVPNCTNEIARSAMANPLAAIKAKPPLS